MRPIELNHLKAAEGFYRDDLGVSYFGDVNGTLVGISPDANDPADQLKYYEHLGKLRFMRPMLKNQIVTYGEEFRFELSKSGSVSKVIFPARLARPFKFKL